ncbi:methyl-accepting chemotaxis protein [Bosea sp. (in: a-proteobacteria)]|uniref:methyl-accepting chemotaxis protein n=1 Tax=Bosea sp. (in: a-proteobacteria) TaxID=1871050 RepID=UPI0027329537|nr:methyl-accepting chemotaxis protein [Bosea sp. (in: a-proteobacteria)]MDP3256757.1 methyl-accepting chemotaxis protein [Bosea sp. (in: a-proteobacteria)]
MKSIRIKIIAILAIVSFGALVSSGLGLWALSHSNNLSQRAANLANVTHDTDLINSHVLGVVMDARGIYMSKDAAAAEPFAKGMEARFPQLSSLAAHLVSITPEAGREQARAIEKAVAEFIAFRTETIRLGRQESTAAANAQGNNDGNRANRKALNDLLVAFGKVNNDASEALEQEADRFTKMAQIGLPITLGVMLLGSLLIALFFAQRSLTKPILDLSGVMGALTRGDLKVAVPHLDRKDEIGTMAKAVAVLRESSEQVAILQQQEQAAAAARLARAQSMEAVVSDVGEVVAAAAAGDFSARLQIDHADEQMQKLVAGINAINSVVDGATSEFSQTLQAIAAGDLTHRVDTAYHGRFADLKSAINETVDRLSSTVKTIQLTSADVGLAAREINMGADDLSKRTEEQASSLEETAATTEELAASVKATAQASRQAASVAQDAMQAAQTGGTIAGQAVDAMARIESASTKISDIIRVIDDIAFQTNLLALNAAVEAARAGDAGKGFAVVASEVRTLAQRSSEAAKDISALISSSNTEVGEGVKLVRQAGEQLSQILSASEKVAATIAEISAASGEQASGIDEMSQAVAHLDEMTQQNAALSEQSAASAGSLSGKIAQLNDLVAAFKTGPEARIGDESARGTHAFVQRAA